ncbi:hypothetical protein PIB30_000535 [Stylosanthes scabra]|uniref:RNase H type-1 domain-containing protein n=1 Tax=Stylosanthes scabra TaxID=79078 RepID=A0ABU6W5T5_9FABA|nr:hypothetical protein [Stylosanthes scabra]
MGFGYVIRDWKGCWQSGCAGTILRTTILQAELFAIWRGFLLVWDMWYRHVLCETDCHKAFVLLNADYSTARNDITDFISRIRELLKRFWRVEVSLIQRTANDVAGALAKYAIRNGVVQVEWLGWQPNPHPRVSYPVGSGNYPFRCGAGFQAGEAGSGFGCTHPYPPWFYRSNREPVLTVRFTQESEDRNCQRFVESDGFWSDQPNRETAGFLRNPKNGVVGCFKKKPSTIARNIKPHSVPHTLHLKTTATLGKNRISIAAIVSRPCDVVSVVHPLLASSPSFSLLPRQVFLARTLLFSISP